MVRSANKDLVDYSRQASIDGDLCIEKESLNMIVGCGGIGFWLAMLLAMSGHTRFVLIDGDTIEASNLNRLPVPQTWIGRNKAVALRKIMRMVRPLTGVVVVNKHITEDSIDIISKLNIRHSFPMVNHRVNIWDTTDDARIQQHINKAVKGLRDRIGSSISVCYKKLGYEGFNVGAYSNYDVWLDPSTYTPGYRTASANAVTSALAAGLGYFAMYLTREDFSINLADAIIAGRPKDAVGDNQQRGRVEAREGQVGQVHAEVDNTGYIRFRETGS